MAGSQDDMERGDQEARERVHHLEHQLGQVNWRCLGNLLLTSCLVQYQRECEELRQQNSSMRTELEQVRALLLILSRASNWKPALGLLCMC